MLALATRTRLFLFAFFVVAGIGPGIAPAKRCLAQSSKVDQPDFGKGAGAAAVQGSGPSVPGFNVLSKEQIERLGQDAAQRLIRSRANQIKQQQDRIREYWRLHNLGPRNADPGILDCDDNRASVHPGAQEICNGIDDNCDGLVDMIGPNPETGEGAREIRTRIFRDEDGDGYGDPRNSELICLVGDALEQRSAQDHTKYVLGAGDCDDRNAEVNPKTGARCGL